MHTGNAQLDREKQQKETREDKIRRVYAEKKRLEQQQKELEKQARKQKITALK